MQWMNKTSENRPVCHPLWHIHQKQGVQALQVASVQEGCGDKQLGDQLPNRMLVRMSYYN